MAEATREEPRTFQIIRYWRDPARKAEVVKTGMTEAEARKHCQDPTTADPNKEWFDGYHDTRRDTENV